MPRKAVRRDEPFADVVASLPPAAPQPEEWPNRSREPVFVDENGVEWRRRARYDAREGKGLERLLRDPEVRVLHEYAFDLTAVVPEDRAMFWRRALESMRNSEYSSFDGAEFVNEARERLLIVHEDC